MIYCAYYCIVLSYAQKLIASGIGILLLASPLATFGYTDCRDVPNCTPEQLIEENISTLLARENIISDDLARRFSSMYGFRNRLVHAYGTLDDAKVAEYLAEHLSDIENVLAHLKLD